MKTKRAWPKTPQEGWLLIRVLGLILALRVLLPRLKLPILLRRLTPSRGAPIPDANTLETAALYTNALLRRIPFALPGPCLPRSLTLYYFATRCGFPVCLHCGIRRVDNMLQGHAWLSLYGQPFLELGIPDQCYAVTFSFPESEQVEEDALLPAIQTPYFTAPSSPPGTDVSREPPASTSASADG